MLISNIGIKLKKEFKMTPKELQIKLSEIRIIIASELPINYDIKVFYTIYQDLVKQALEFVDQLSYKSMELRYYRNFPMQLSSIADAKNKDYITVKEFELLYSYGDSWQKERRKRVHNPLPTVSKYKNKILYDHNQIKIWLHNEIFK